MVYLTGDTHGELDRFKHGRLRWLGKRDIVVVQDIIQQMNQH